MEQITVLNIFWLMLATAAITGIVTILSALVTGYLIFRTKKEAHETLFPIKREKRNKPIIKDDFAMEQEEEGLPDIIKKMNGRMNADLVMSGLKREKV